MLIKVHFNDDQELEGTSTAYSAYIELKKSVIVHICVFIYAFSICVFISTPSSIVLYCKIPDPSINLES